ncbi:hypothetical protein PGTUg99_028536 [Puccinia graminis f. sp. tritici]|uniref:Uncharacterized protein n=1 Tax=Puccinia graminis f. sp. tritici TaxID=56615 RepID=A0A5B0P2G4_PUCGR|nr:hypothetical protein PGTUg99_028536 [Puccinia graminis f. sp. tritici]
MPGVKKGSKGQQRIYESADQEESLLNHLPLKKRAEKVLKTIFSHGKCPGLPEDVYLYEITKKMTANLLVLRRGSSQEKRAGKVPKMIFGHGICPGLPKDV